MFERNGYIAYCMIEAREGGKEIGRMKGRGGGEGNLLQPTNNINITSTVISLKRTLCPSCPSCHSADLSKLNYYYSRFLACTLQLNSLET